MIIMGDKLYFCYILTNKNRTVVYIGYTEDLIQRVEQHQNGTGTNFTNSVAVSKGWAEGSFRISFIG